MKSNGFNQFIKPIIVLVLICFVISGALAWADGLTRPVIENNAKKAADQARLKLLPDGGSFKQYEGELLATEDGKVKVTEVFTAENGGAVITVETKSFGGALTEMVGIDTEGAVTGIVITDHADTPGVGTRAQEPEHLAQYTGLSELNATSAKQDPAIQHVTGASVSSNAIHYGVYEALAQYREMGGAE